MKIILIPALFLGVALTLSACSSEVVAPATPVDSSAPLRVIPAPAVGSSGLAVVPEVAPEVVPDASAVPDAEMFTSQELADRGIEPYVEAPMPKEDKPATTDAVKTSLDGTKLSESVDPARALFVDMVLGYATSGVSTDVASVQAIKVLSTVTGFQTPMQILNVSGGLDNSSSLIPDAGTVVKDDGKAITVTKSFTSDKLLKIGGKPTKQTYDIRATFNVTGGSNETMFLESITNVQIDIR
jgi:hypothetical protein